MRKKRLLPEAAKLLTAIYETMAEDVFPFLDKAKAAQHIAALHAIGDIQLYWDEDGDTISFKVTRRGRKALEAEYGPLALPSRGRA